MANGEKISIALPREMAASVREARARPEGKLGEDR